MINDDQKIRIILSSSAQMTIADDMDIFGVDKRNQFINTILNNYFKHAKASLLIYRTNRISALCDTSEDEHMSTEELENKEAIVTDIVDAEIREYANNIKKSLHIKGNRRFCYINKYNMKFLADNGYKEASIYVPLLKNTVLYHLSKEKKYSRKRHMTSLTMQLIKNLFFIFLMLKTLIRFS